MGINGGGRVATESLSALDRDQTDAMFAHAEGNDMSELTKTLQVLLTQEEHEELERFADSRGLSAPTVAREASSAWSGLRPPRVLPRIVGWSKTGRFTPDPLACRSRGRVGFP